MENIVIIGGGIAGLTCLNALLDAGMPACLYEAGLIGSPKMCGEFISPQAVEILQGWGLETIYPIEKVAFHTRKNAIQHRLSLPAGAISRSKAEKFLAERAQRLGGVIHENVHITDIIPPHHANNFYRFRIADKEIQAKAVFFATGKFSKSITHQKPTEYIGIKMHLPRSSELDGLSMFSLSNAYLGWVPISNEVSNFACLVKQPASQKFGFRNFMQASITECPKLASLAQHIHLKNQYRLQIQTPGFGLRTLPNWPNAYWIGDALGSLQPAVGAGFTHAMASAFSAVQDYVDNTKAQNRLYKIKLRRKFWFGHCMHVSMLNPKISNVLIHLSRYPLFRNSAQALFFSPL